MKVLFTITELQYIAKELQSIDNKQAKQIRNKVLAAIRQAENFALISETIGKGLHQVN